MPGLLAELEPAELSELFRHITRWRDKALKAEKEMTRGAVWTAELVMSAHELHKELAELQNDVHLEIASRRPRAGYRPRHARRPWAARRDEWLREAEGWLTGSYEDKYASDVEELVRRARDLLTEAES